MGKIKIKLIKYFIFIITVIVVICFIASSIFLSKFYINMKYNSLKNAAEEIHNMLKTNNNNLSNTNLNLTTNVEISSAVLYKDGSIIPPTQNKMGMMPLLRSINLTTLQEKGSFKTSMNQEFLYYKYHTSLGDIIVLQNNQFSSDYLHVVYIILLLVFLVAIFLSIPLISYASKKFTEPILKLQKASHELSQGNFKIDFTVNTKDEIEELSDSLQLMSLNLEHKHALQRDFIANVSHDFKTPLSIIRSYSEAIYDGLIDEENIKSFSQDIIKEVDRLNYLVIDLLELSKLQGGTHMINKDYFNLNEFLTSFEDTFKSISQSKNIKLTISSPNIDINADSKYLYRVLYNFVDNAFKFSQNFSEINLSAIQHENGIKISVKDHGIGIEKNMLDDIWDRYYKHSQSGGIGLGLSICSEILKMHGFIYGVTSTPNVETEFYFIIPYSDIR
jgi:signal transduction histidine kinase